VLLEPLAEQAPADGQRRGVIVLGPVANVLDDPEPTSQ
jgi:hypothetical protein